MRSLDLMCFPWAVVEVKSAAVDVSTERMCYCQAANASAAALSLREKLLLASKKNEPNPEALVIFSFTCVGTHVKLWLTYRPTVSCQGHISHFALGLTYVRRRRSLCDVYGQLHWKFRGVSSSYAWCLRICMNGSTERSDQSFLDGLREPGDVQNPGFF